MASGRVGSGRWGGVGVGLGHFVSACKRTLEFVLEFWAIFIIDM